MDSNTGIMTGALPLMGAVIGGLAVLAGQWYQARLLARAQRKEQLRRGYAELRVAFDEAIEAKRLWHGRVLDNDTYGWNHRESETQRHDRHRATRRCRATALRLTVQEQDSCLRDMLEGVVMLFDDTDDPEMDPSSRLCIAKKYFASTAASDNKKLRELIERARDIHFESPSRSAQHALSIKNALPVVLEQLCRIAIVVAGFAGILYGLDGMPFRAWHLAIWASWLLLCGTLAAGTIAKIARKRAQKTEAGSSTRCASTTPRE
jgi:hypothetical protein